VYPDSAGTHLLPFTCSTRLLLWVTAPDHSGVSVCSGLGLVWLKADAMSVFSCMMGAEYGFSKMDWSSLTTDRASCSQQHRGVAGQRGSARRLYRRSFLVDSIIRGLIR
jgi:hypothetical protein